jgi:hypothetical protein
MGEKTAVESTGNSWTFQEKQLQARCVGSRRFKFSMIHRDTRKTGRLYGKTKTALLTPCVSLLLLQSNLKGNNLKRGKIYFGPWCEKFQFIVRGFHCF